jgi:hypothetical protein
MKSSKTTPASILWKFLVIGFFLSLLVTSGCSDDGPDIKFDDQPPIEKDDVEFRNYVLEEVDGKEVKTGSKMKFQLSVVTEIGITRLKVSITDDSIERTQYILDEHYNDQPLFTSTLLNEITLGKFSIPKLNVRIEAVDVNNKRWRMDTSLVFSDYLHYVGEVVLLDSIIGYDNSTASNIHYREGYNLVDFWKLKSTFPGPYENWDVFIRTGEDLLKSGRPIRTRIYKIKEPLNYYAFLEGMEGVKEADLRVHHIDGKLATTTLHEEIEIMKDDNFTGGWLLVKLRDNKYNKRWSLLYIYDTHNNVRNVGRNILVGTTRYKARLYDRPSLQ